MKKNHTKYPIERIDIILDKIKEIWKKDSDMSFSELFEKLNMTLVNGRIDESDSELLENLDLEPREKLLWGHFGRTGKDPIQYLFIKDLESEHIKNILLTQKLDHTKKWINMKNELIKELNRRKLDTLLIPNSEINNKKSSK